MKTETKNLGVKTQEKGGYLPRKEGSGKKKNNNPTETLIFNYTILNNAKIHCCGLRSQLSYPVMALTNNMENNI